MVQKSFPEKSNIRGHAADGGETFEIDMSRISFDWDRLGHGNSHYTPEQKMGAVIAYVMTGNLSEASRIVGLSHPTLRKWKQESPWWNDACRAAQKYLNQKLDGRLTKLINLMLSRIENKVVSDDVGAAVLIQGVTTLFNIRERTRATAYEMKGNEADASTTPATLNELHNRFTKIGTEEEHKH